MAHLARLMQLGERRRDFFRVRQEIRAMQLVNIYRLNLQPLL